jgi:hypothetical protein
MSKKLSKFIIKNGLTDEVSPPILINAKEAEKCRLAVFYSYGGSLDDIKFGFKNPDMKEAMHITMTVPDDNYNKVIKLLNEVKAS